VFLFYHSIAAVLLLFIPRTHLRYCKNFSSARPSNGDFHPTKGESQQVIPNKSNVNHLRDMRYTMETFWSRFVLSLYLCGGVVAHGLWLVPATFCGFAETFCDILRDVLHHHARVQPYLSFSFTNCLICSVVISVGRDMLPNGMVSLSIR
jgi:hypothetical protein